MTFDVTSLKDQFLVIIKNISLMASAILDRLLEEAHVIKIPGRSYRLKTIGKEQKKRKKLGNEKKSA